MSNRIVVILATGNPEKARAGTMYAVNALKNAWMEDVRLFLFGPSEDLVLEDTALQELLSEYLHEEGKPIACRYLAEQKGTEDRITALGIEVSYVGEKISELIKDGYTPLVW